MNTTYLYEFLALAQTLSFTKAAKALYLSQSVLSKHIQQLEESLGVPLFIRDSHSVTLTEAGRILQSDGPKLLQKWDDVTLALRRGSYTSRGKVRIGMGLELSYSVHLSSFFQNFSRENPGIELIYDVFSSNTPLQTILRYDVFFTPCVFPDLPGSVSAHFLRNHSIHAILPLGHELMSRSVIHLQQLAGQTIIVPHAEELFGPYAQNYLLAEKATHEKIPCIKVDNLATALLLVSIGKGVCLAPGYVANMLPPKTFSIPVADRSCKFSEYLYYQELGNPASALFLREFLDDASK